MVNQNQEYWNTSWNRLYYRGEVLGSSFSERGGIRAGCPGVCHLLIHWRLRWQYSMANHPQGLVGVPNLLRFRNLLQHPNMKMARAPVRSPSTRAPSHALLQ